VDKVSSSACDRKFQNLCALLKEADFPLTRKGERKGKDPPRFVRMIGAKETMAEKEPVAFGGADSLRTG